MLLCLRDLSRCLVSFPGEEAGSAPGSFLKAVMGTLVCQSVRLGPRAPSPTGKPTGRSPRCHHTGLQTALHKGDTE